MKANAYLVFDGNCRQAAEYYGEVFGKTPQIMTYEQMPPDPAYTIPEEMKDKVIHAEVALDDGDVLMMSDNVPGMPYAVGNNYSIALICKDLRQTQTLYDKLKEGGVVIMELQETFWSPAYGQVGDRFGVNWMLDYDDGRPR